MFIEAIYKEMRAGAGAGRRRLRRGDARPQHGTPEAKGSGESGRTVTSTAVAAAVAVRLRPRRCRAVSWSAAGAAAHAARGGAGRPHRELGVGRHRGLGVADGHARRRATTRACRSTPRGGKVADTWDPSKDGLCEAYGVGGIMRMPGRLRISWQDDTTLKIETDAGQQTRLLRFAAQSPAAGPRGRARLCRAIRWPSGLAAAPATSIRSPDAATARAAAVGLAEGPDDEHARRAGCGATACPTARTPSSPSTSPASRIPQAGDWFVVTTTVDDPDLPDAAVHHQLRTSRRNRTSRSGVPQPAVRGRGFGSEPRRPECRMPNADCGECQRLRVINSELAASSCWPQRGTPEILL